VKTFCLAPKKILRRPMTQSSPAILIILLPILGTIIYLLARPADAGTSKRRHNHRGRRPGRPAARPAIHPLEERI
jgi:hypothetical protein